MGNRFFHFSLFPSYWLCKLFLIEFEYIRQNIIQHRWAQVSWRQKFNYAKQQPAEKRDPGVTWRYVPFHFFFFTSIDSHLDRLVDFLHFVKGENLICSFCLGRVTNIPQGMVTDQFGMIGLLTFIRAAETDPGMVHLALGSDLTTLGLNLNSPE